MNGYAVLNPRHTAGTLQTRHPAHTATQANFLSSEKEKKKKAQFVFVVVFVYCKRVLYRNVSSLAYLFLQPAQLIKSFPNILSVSYGKNVFTFLFILYIYSSFFFFACLIH